MWDFNRIWLIAKREVVTRFKQRAYRVTLIIQVIIAALAGLAPVAIAMFTDDSSGGQVAVVDEASTGFADRMGPYLDGQAIPGMPELTLSSETYSAEEARDAVKNDDLSAAVIVTGSAEAPAYEIVTGSDGPLEVTNLQVQNAVVSANVQYLAEAEGVSAEQAQGLVQAPDVTVQDVEGETGGIEGAFSGPEFVLINIGIIIMYMAFIMFGMWIAQGVVEEKASRIMEIMVNAATPRDLLFGKVIGVLIAGMAQLVPMLLVGGLMFGLQPRIAEALDVTLPVSLQIDFASLSVRAISVLLVYLVFGFLLYGALFAATGSLVSRQEEVNQTVGPPMVLVVAGLMLGYAVMALPNSLLAKWLFMIPFTSPFVGMSRILLGDPSTMEIALSIGILAVSSIIAMWIAAKIYRVGVLMYGQKASFMSLMKLGRMQRVAR